MDLGIGGKQAFVCASSQGFRSGLCDGTGGRRRERHAKRAL